MSDGLIAVTVRSEVGKATVVRLDVTTEGYIVMTPAVPGPVFLDPLVHAPNLIDAVRRLQPVATRRRDEYRERVRQERLRRDEGRDG